MKLFAQTLSRGCLMKPLTFTLVLSTSTPLFQSLLGIAILNKFNFYLCFCPPLMAYMHDKLSCSHSHTHIAPTDHSCIQLLLRITIVKLISLFPSP